MLRPKGLVEHLGHAGGRVADDPEIHAILARQAGRGGSREGRSSAATNIEEGRGLNEKWTCYALSSGTI
jgi:hypothetical protein